MPSARSRVPSWHCESRAALTCAGAGCEWLRAMLRNKGPSNQEAPQLPVEARRFAFPPKKWTYKSNAAFSTSVTPFATEASFSRRRGRAVRSISDRPTGPAHHEQQRPPRSHTHPARRLDPLPRPLSTSS